MTSHRPPPPARTPRVMWVIAAGAAIGIVGPPVVALAQTVAPQVAAQTALAWPEQTPEPVGHGGLGGELALPSVGVLPPGASMPMGVAEPPPTRPSFSVTEPRNTLTTTREVPGTPNRHPEAVLSQSVAITGTPEPTNTPPPTTEAAQTTAEPTPTLTPEDSTTASATPTETTATTQEADVTETTRRHRER